MTDVITTCIQNTFTANPYWLTVIVSIIPTIEVRGAITISIGLGINPWIAWLLACASAVVVCPCLLFCFVPLLRLLKNIKAFNKLAMKIEDLFRNKAQKLENDAALNNLQLNSELEKKVVARKFLSIFLFVAIPLPLTGLWTGSAVAAFVDLDYKYSAFAIILGNLACGFIITLLNIVLGPYASLILFVLLIFVVISIVSIITALFIKKRHKKSEK